MDYKVTYPVQEAMVELTGACFWYWESFHNLLRSCGVPKEVYSRYVTPDFNKYQAMRNVLFDLQSSGRTEPLESLISTFYRMKTAMDRDRVDEERAKRLLKEFRELIGNDPVETEIQAIERARKQAAAKTRTEAHLAAEGRLAALNTQILELHSSEVITPQQRGYKLEELFYELLGISEFDYTGSYRTQGEQIDGHFRYGSFDYLLEIKWTQKVAEQADVSILDGKLKGKAQSTRGFFLSMAGFNKNAIDRFSGDSPRIVLMDGRDLMLILSGNVSFIDAMKIKVDALVRYGHIYSPLSD